MEVMKVKNIWLLYDLTPEQNNNFIEFCQKQLKPNILPLPVVRYMKGKLVKDYSLRDWFLKLQEESFEAIEEISDSGFYDQCSAEEIADVITVCISWLEAKGFDEGKRSKLFAAVNEKNQVRGYFDED